MTRLIAKFGTESLVDKSGKLGENIFAEIARQVATVLKEGNEVLIVSSGAIQAGKEEAKRLNIAIGDFSKKDLAGFGSPKLMAMWQKAFDRHQILTAQVLVTHASLNDKGERDSTVSSLFHYCRSGRVVGIINENDVVSAIEITLMTKKISENDQLARLIGEAVHADAILCITSVGGVFEQDPRIYPDAKMFLELDIGNLAKLMTGTNTKSSSGSGGMDRKLTEMAKCCQSGRRVAIGSIANDGIIRFVNGEPVGTLLGNTNRF